MKIELFKKLCANFNKEPNEDLYLLWNEEFKDYDTYYLELAILNIIRNDIYFPTISRVLEVLKNISVEIPEEEKEKRMKENGIQSQWIDKEIMDHPIDKKTQKEFDDFQMFLKEFREN